MATLKGSTIASTFDQLVQRAASYSQTGTNIELMDDTSNAVAKPTGLYLESGATTDFVGIGIAAPACLLDIGVNDGGVQKEMIRFSSTSGGGLMASILYVSNGATDGSNKIIFQVDNAAGTPQNIMYLDGDGRGGINTGIPGGSASSGLEVRGDGTNAADGGSLILSRLDSVVVAGDYIGQISFAGNADGSSGESANMAGASIRAVVPAGEAWDADDQNKPTVLQFFTEDGSDNTGMGSPRMVIDQSGKVGIGIATPAKELEVYGNIVSRASQSDAGDAVALVGGTHGGALWASTNYVVGSSGANWTECLTVTGEATGTPLVGINVNTPDATLEVAGTAYAWKGHNSNTVFGYNAGLSAHASGQENTFIGYLCADATCTATTDGNTGVGANALAVLTSANGNTAVGVNAGLALTDGSQNTFIGGGAGDAGVGADGNVCIGYGSDCGANVDNQIAVGYTTVTDGANRGRWGNASIGTNNIQTDWSIDSDIRIKKDIENSDIGLSFINALKTRKYKKKHPSEYDAEILEARYKQGGANYDDDKDEIIKDEFDDNKVLNGLIAQEVKAVMDDLGVVFSGWSEDTKGQQSIQYSTLVVPLIKAVQELSAKVTALENA